MKLYTLQTINVDIVTNTEPTADYTERGGPFYELSEYLGWAKWIWCLRDFSAFELNDYFRLRRREVLWVLEVPERSMVWASLERQCEGREPGEYVFTHWRGIEAAGEIAMGLVKAPIAADWVLFRYFVEPYNEV